MNPVEKVYCDLQFMHHQALRKGQEERRSDTLACLELLRKLYPMEVAQYETRVKQEAQ